MTTDEPELEPRRAIETATATRRRRRLSRRQRRMLLLLVGGLIGAGSLAGFVLTARALDERVEVVVASFHIEAGEVLTADHLAPELAHPGSIPHVPWSAATVNYFDGLVAAHPIQPGSLVTPSMMVEPGQQAVGAELLLEVPLDTSLAPDGVSDGDLVLLVDPGAEPTGEEGGDGRPARVLRSFEAENVGRSGMRLFLEPEPWAEWRADLDAAGGRLQVVPVPLGGDPDELARRLDTVWRGEWIQALAAARADLQSEQGPGAGPGELEVVVRLDERLAPSGVIEGDLVLLIDPGQPPTQTEAGRPRVVLRTLELADYDNRQVRLFVPPEEWVWWSGLVEALGADPMVLPVADGTDAGDLAARLDSQWFVEWELRVDALARIE